MFRRLFNIVIERHLRKKDPKPVRQATKVPEHLLPSPAHGVDYELCVDAGKPA